MRDMTAPVLRLVDLPRHGISVEDVTPLEMCPVGQTVFCIHCYSLYPFGDSVLCLDGVIYCPVTDCEGSLIDQVPVVETQDEEDEGKGWYRDGLVVHMGSTVRAARLADLVWAGSWAAMSTAQVKEALREARA